MDFETFVKDLAVRTLYELRFRGFDIDEDNVDKIAEAIKQWSLIEDVYKLHRLWNNVYERNTWGVEIEFSPSILNELDKYVLYIVVMKHVLKLYRDLSGPWEIVSPPMKILDLNALKSLVKVVKELEIEFVNTYTDFDRNVSMGRHIHIRPNYPLYESFNILVHVIPWLTPFMASVDYVKKKFFFRPGASRFSMIPPSSVTLDEFRSERRYWYITFNPASSEGGRSKNETLEIRFNESSPIESWATAFTCLMILEPFATRSPFVHKVKNILNKLKLDLNDISLDVFYSSSGFTLDTKLKTRDGNLVRIGDAFDEITTCVIEYAESRDLHEHVKLYSLIVENVKNMRKVVKPQDFDELYGSFVN